MTNDPTCAICGRPMADQALVDAHCAAKAGEKLHAIAELAGPARLVAAGLVRRGDGGGGSNKPGSRPPLNDGATDALDAITNTLTTIAREIADTRGLQAPRDGNALADPLTVVCKWLTGQMEWLRHATDDQGGPLAVTMFDEIGACAGRIRRLVDGPGSQRYLGPCGALAGRCPYCTSEDRDRREAIDEGDGPAWCDHGWHDGDADPCDGDVYARDGASTGRCKICKAEVSTTERQAWLDDEVRASSFRASEIEDAYGVRANTIRQWATPDRALVRVHDRDFLGRARYMLGEVLDVAAGQAAKRAEAQAKRARREAAQDAESRSGVCRGVK